MTKILHSRACRDLLLRWWSQPRGSVRYRLAGIGYDLTDIQIRDLLLTIFDEDPADSEAVAAARELWPLLVLTEPLHTPEELNDELAAVIREHETLLLRVQALGAKFRALEPWSERWDCCGADAQTSEFGHQNLQWVALALESAGRSAATNFVREQLEEARMYGAKVREYDTTEEIR
ncbi:hypothetical protein ACQP1O_42850 (plasmid) [Nocardia sp. CA-151230]|uniref:hypothetical protein n=1 Tax=Nocardia sp. CA-151230 TaxID=3239982 RepID=UPI003D928616